MRLLVAFRLLPILVCIGCGSSMDSETEVELWVQGDLSRVEGLERIEFVIRDAHLQPAGFEIYPDHRITAEWRLMDLVAESFLCHSSNVLPQKVATLRVQESRFDRVFLRPKTLTALRLDATALTVKNVMEPIAAQFETGGEPVRILLKLIVLPTSRGDEDISIFAQDTEVLSD